MVDWLLCQVSSMSVTFTRKITNNTSYRYRIVLVWEIFMNVWMSTENIGKIIKVSLCNELLTTITDDLLSIRSCWKLLFYEARISVEYKSDMCFESSHTSSVGSIEKKLYHTLDETRFFFYITAFHLVFSCWHFIWQYCSFYMRYGVKTLKCQFNICYM